MAKQKFYEEDELLQMFQEGKIGWLDYVNYHSAEWQEEYMEYCIERGKDINNDTAEEFVNWKSEQLEKALADENA